MMENKMAWQEGYEHGYAAAMEHFNEACEQEYKDGYERGRNEHNKEITKLTAERDALLADVSDYQGSICCYCKNFTKDNEEKQVYCGHFGDFPTSDGGIPLMCGRWEWRGVNHDKE